MLKKEVLNNCFYCSDKWECYDRLFKGRTNPCTDEEKVINLKKYRLWDTNTINGSIE